MEQTRGSAGKILKGAMGVTTGGILMAATAAISGIPPLTDDHAVDALFALAVYDLVFYAGLAITALSILVYWVGGFGYGERP